MPKRDPPPPLSLDYIDKDTAHALQYLLQMCESGQVTGMVFALSLKDRKHPHLCGASGRLAKNTLEASAISNMLALKLTQEALDISLGK